MKIANVKISQALLFDMLKIPIGASVRGVKQEDPWSITLTIEDEGLKDIQEGDSIPYVCPIHKVEFSWYDEGEVKR